VGEARRFGEGVAILVGDLAFVYADQLLSDPPAAARRIWNELRVELNVGQYLDILGTATGERDRDVAVLIARYKSGKYTVERPLHLGAMLAAPEREAELLPALSAYGLPLGDAFQLRDDVLGAFGDSSVTGKPVGDDLREGKPTPLLAIATERATPAQREVLATVGRSELSGRGVAAIQEVLVDTGALAELEEVIERLASEALDAVGTAPITDDARRALTELAHYVAWRER
jgi:geranylgeranyl diphosphate synthase type I